MPGCGKSTVGKHLARQLGWAFVDSDTEIERALGHSIREHFERFGEPSFRDAEAAQIARLSALPQTVVATGGGAVLREENRHALRSAGNQVVYLRAQVDDLARRLRHDTQRPLLQTADPAERLRALFKVRDPLYREVADHVIDTGRSSVAALAHLVAMQLELGGGQAATGRSSPPCDPEASQPT
jgi:shikimate kinase